MQPPPAAKITAIMQEDDLEALRVASTGIMLRSIGDIARAEGEDLLLGIVFKRQIRVHHGPEMRGANECQQAQQVLATPAAEGMTECEASTLRPARFHENKGGGAEQPIL